MNYNFLFPELLNKNIHFWSQLSSDVHVEVPQKKQKENSKDLLLLKKTFLKWLDSGNSLSELKTEENQTVIKGKLLAFMINTLEIDAWVCELLDKENYYEVSYKFIERAKELIEGISFEDIFQALRNIWVIVALQIYMDEEVRLTDAMFAYSMLYPLTDNYLDNPKIPINDKKSFNDRFWQKISDNIDKPLNDLEKRIFSMIDLIENDFPRTEYPNVFKGLLTILDGQQKSLLQHKANDLSDSNLLMYTFYKGGASVLADAFLVRGELTDDEASFAYAYGIILQLADDLQDLFEDLKNHHVTPYNRRSREDSLDNFFNKHQNYTLDFLTNTFQTTTDKQRAIKQLLDKSLELLLFGGVCDNQKCFSSSFIKQFMKRSRFSCRSFKKLNSKIEKKIKL